MSDMLSKIEESVEYAPGKSVTFETGRLAKQASGSVAVKAGDAFLLCTMCYGGESSMGFFPLTVDYREKAYAAGKFPGGYFKREARPTDAEVLTARLIDRPIRPMFPEGFMREVQVILNVLSYDKDLPIDTFGISAASVAVGLSEVPFEEQVAAVRVVKNGDEYLINPDHETSEAGELEMILAGTAESVVMVEGGAWEVQEADIVAGIQAGHEAIKKLVAAQNALIAKINPVKKEFVLPIVDKELYAKVEELVVAKLRETFHTPMVKTHHYPAMAAIKDELLATLGEEYADRAKEIKGYFADVERVEMRNQILNEQLRIDGRGPADIRAIEIENQVLPSVHGSALFQRGETQGLVAATLGTKDDEQHIETLGGTIHKNYNLHYNFPPFSVGEVKRTGSVSRREIGHGQLAERSLNPVLPHPEDFPYTIRLVSEILESNGSSSMASVCGGSLALMDAGVPTKAHVAGIAMGMISEGDKYQILSDITGTEDHLGDMDFKITGTKEGVTAFQMDIKIKGITAELMSEALIQAKAGRNHILGKMDECMSEPRPQVSEKAPAIISLKIDSSKIRDIIGPGGNVIRGIQSTTGTNLSVDDNGNVTIAAPTRKAGDVALKMVQEIVAEAEVDKVYMGKVKSVVNFGAFIEILPGKEGLLHISEIQHEKTDKVEDVLSVGDELEIKCIGVDPRGKIKLSRKALLPRPEAQEA